MSHPFEITAAEVQDVIAASALAPAALATADGKFMVGPAQLIDDTFAHWDVVLRSEEIRDLLASITKHVERLYVGDYKLTREGATLVALLVNERRTAVLDDGTPVAIIHPAE